MACLLSGTSLLSNAVLALKVAISNPEMSMAAPELVRSVQRSSGAKFLWLLRDEACKAYLWASLLQSGLCCLTGGEWCCDRGDGRLDETGRDQAKRLPEVTQQVEISLRCHSRRNQSSMQLCPVSSSSC